MSVDILMNWDMDKRENEIVDGSEEQSEDEREEQGKTRDDRDER